MSDEVLDEAMRHLRDGAPEEAAAVLRTAVEAGPRSQAVEARQAHLTLMMNLGDLLVHLGRLDDAVAVLRKGLEGRAQLYGRAHPGYAYGLEPLAEALLKQGEIAQALPLAERAVEIFWNDAHERAAELMPLRAILRLAADRDADGFQDLAGMPEPLIDTTVQATLDRAPGLSAELRASVLTSLQSKLTEARGADHPSVAAVTTALGQLG